MTLGKAARGAFGVFQVNVQLAAKRGLHIAVLGGEGFGVVHIFADAGEFLEIGFDIVAGFAARNGELAGKAEGGDAVDDAEINRLGAPPHHRVHAFNGFAKHLAGRHGVNIMARFERIAQGINPGNMGEQAQLNL